MDLQLDTTNADLEIINGELLLTSGIDSIRQHLQIRFQFFRGEWSLDLRLGVPWFEEVLRKAPDLQVVRSLLRDVILTTPGVISLSSFLLDYDAPTRALSLDFEAITVLGPLEFDELFIIPRPGI